MSQTIAQYLPALQERITDYSIFEKREDVSLNRALEIIKQERVFYNKVCYERLLVAFDFLQEHSIDCVPVLVSRKRKGAYLLGSALQVDGESILFYRRGEFQLQSGRYPAICPGLDVCLFGSSQVQEQQNFAGLFGEKLLERVIENHFSRVNLKEHKESLL
ncbi:MAG: hypothetical protein ACMXYF_04935 [Candidatus Woesearchaeota archaeon]